MSWLIRKLFHNGHNVNKSQKLCVKPQKSSGQAESLPYSSFAIRPYEILKDSLRLMETTTHPKTFFGRYDTALSSARMVIEFSPDSGSGTYAQRAISDLTEHRNEKIREFIDRCSRSRKLHSIKDELLSGQYDIPEDIKMYIESLTQSTKEDNTSAPESGKYIYCSLSFSAGGRTYYYKTTDETLKCGDEVIVPVGNGERKAIARIEKVERFPVGKTPYPPSQTRNILGKCPY